MCHLTTGIHSEKCVVSQFHCCANIVDCTYANLHGYSLLLLRYKPVQHVSVQNNRRVNLAQERMMHSNVAVNEMSEAAAGTALHTVYSKTIL